MRSAKLFSVLGFVLLVSLMVAFVGCGSDDTPTGIVGSLTDPEFVAVQGQVETFVDSTLQFVLDGLGSMSTISSGGNIDPIYYGPVFPDSDQVTISYVDGWHIVNLIKSRSDYSFAIIDSVQFYAGDAVSQTGIDVDSLWYRHYWSYGVANTDVTYAAFEGASSFDFRGLQTEVATIDGSNSLVVESKVVTDLSTVYRDFEFTSDISNLVVSKTMSGWEQACPTSGTISSTITMTYAENDGADVVTTWAVAIIFTNGAVAVSVQSGDVTWTYNDIICSPPN